MSSLDFVPADKLAASYAAGSQVLTLYAEGRVVTGVSNIHFRREPWTGGLLFVLEGWYPMLLEPATAASELGHGPEIGTQAYTETHKFQVPNLKLLDPSNTVIIRDANYPTQGVQVKIHWLMTEAEEKENDSAPQQKALAISALEQSKVSPPAVFELGADPIHISVLEGSTVDIRERAFTEPKSYLRAVFDKDYLSLAAASLQNGNMVWSVKGEKIGLTQFVIFGYGGTGEGMFRTVVYVQVYGLKQ